MTNTQALTHNKQPSDKFWYSATIIFMVIELARPQAIIPIGFLRPGMITTLILVICLLMKTKDQVIKSRQAKWIFFFILLVTVYIPFAVNNYLAYLIALSMWLQFPFILSCIILINTQERLINFLTWFVGIMIYLSFYSLSHGGRGPGGVVADENDLTLLIIIVLPFAFILLSETKKLLHRLVLITGIVTALLAIVTASSRGGFVGLIVAGGVAWLLSKKKTLILIGIILMATIIYITGGDSFRQEMSTITDTKESTAQQRILSWEAGWDIFLDHPLGIGSGNYPVWLPEYQFDKFQHGMWGRVAHSLWFTLLPELGIIGTWIYFLIIFQNLKDIQFIKKTKSNFHVHLSTVFYSSLAGFFASATFLSVLYYPHFWYVTALISASRIVADASPQSINNKP